LGEGRGVLFWSLGWVIAALGGGFVGAIALGLLPRGSLQFDPDGMTIAERGVTFKVPWDAISGISSMEYNDNPALLVWLHDDALATAQPPSRPEKVAARLATNTGWLGAPIVVMTRLYGLDLPLLQQAMERYVTEVAARRELAIKSLPGT
jgi:hypothetical protein